MYKSFRSKHPILSLGMCPENLVPGQFPISLFRSKRFALNKMFKRKAAKFEISYISENPFGFSFRATLQIYETNARKSNKLHDFSYT